MKAAAGLAAAVCAAVMSLACPVQAQPSPSPQPPPLARPIRLDARPLPLNADDPAQTRVGALTYAGGVQLTSPDTASLGGLSGVAVAPDGPFRGLDFISQSDEGWLLRGRIALDETGRLIGVTQASYARLADEKGEPLQGKTQSDAEDVTWMADGGYAVSFERDHRVIRYRAKGSGGVRLAVSPDIFKREPNSALEGLAYNDGAIFEGAEDGEIWRCGLEPDARCESVMAASPFRGFSLTGLSPCGEGFVAVYRAVDVLHGWRAVIAYLAPTDPKGGGPWRAHALAALGRPLTRDNMEGISSTPLPDGAGWRLYVVSDDNFSRDQRTLLMAFDWKTTPK